MFVGVKLVRNVTRAKGEVVRKTIRNDKCYYPSILDNLIRSDLAKKFSTCSRYGLTAKLCLPPPVPTAASDAAVAGPL